MNNPMNSNIFTCPATEESVNENVTSQLSEFDGLGNTGTYDWQLNIYAVQGQGYQQVVTISIYDVTSFGSGGGKVYANMTINAALTSTWISAFATFNSSGYPMTFSWYVQFGSQWQVYNAKPTYENQPQAYDSVLTGFATTIPGDVNAYANFLSGSGYFTYYGVGLNTIGYPCTPLPWNTAEDSNMQYSGSYSCSSNNNVCSQQYYLTSGNQWTTGYLINPANGRSWNGQTISDTGYSWLTGDYPAPSCPTYVSIYISGTTSTDVYSRYISEVFNEGTGGNANLGKSYGEDNVTWRTIENPNSFTINKTISQSYVNTKGTEPFLLFQFTTFTGSWSITAKIHYYSLGSCVGNSLGILQFANSSKTGGSDNKVWVTFPFPVATGHAIIVAASIASGNDITITANTPTDSFGSTFYKLGSVATSPYNLYSSYGGIWFANAKSSGIDQINLTYNSGPIGFFVFEIAGEHDQFVTKTASDSGTGDSSSQVSSYNYGGNGGFDTGALNFAVGEFVDSNAGTLTPDSSTAQGYALDGSYFTGGNGIQHLYNNYDDDTVSRFSFSNTVRVWSEVSIAVSATSWDF